MQTESMMNHLFLRIAGKLYCCLQAEGDEQHYALVDVEADQIVRMGDAKDLPRVLATMLDEGN